MTKLWLVNWSDTGDYEALRDDVRDWGVIDLAEPKGVILDDIDSIGIIQEMAVEEWRSVYQEDFEEHQWVAEREGDYIVYRYGDDGVMIARLVDVYSAVHQ